MPTSEIAHLPLLNQFTVSEVRPAGYECVFEIDGWFVGYDKKYSATKILDSRGALIGYFLGGVIDPTSISFQPSSVTISWEPGCEADLLETGLYEKAGYWIAIVVTNDVRAIYLDACGSLPLVYSAIKKRAGASALAVLDEGEYFNDLYDEVKAETWFTSDWYHTAGLTAHKSLKRLLPNHRLNLTDWSVERVWPRDKFERISPDRTVSEVGDAASRIIESVAQDGRMLVPLTAGNETRALLSLVRNYKSDALFFTGSFPGADVDLGTARRLSKRFGLTHVETKVTPRTKENAELWRMRTGHCVGGAIGLFRMDRKNIAGVDVELSGAAGEVGRGFLWSPADSAQDRLTSDVLLARLKLPRVERFVVAVDRWLETVAQFDAFTVMDLAYVELKMACWAGPQATGSESDIPQIWPFSSRKSFAAMMSSPPHMRLEQSLFKKLVENAWPELLEIPINKGTFLENTRKLIYRASSPRRVWGRIRKQLAKTKSR